MAGHAKYVLRFFLEWDGGCLWPGNDIVREELGLGPYDLLDPCPLPLSAAMLEQCRRIAQWHDTSLNRDYPSDPGPWRQPDCDRFNAAVAELLAAVRRELGPEFEVIDKQIGAIEDPDLDAYLADPKGFHRER